jgi:iron complex outermembrane receptor protein
VSGHCRRALAAAWLCASAALCATVHAADAPDTIVITGPRVPESSAQLPMSVDRLDSQQIRQGQLQVNLSESLDMLPGVNAQQRQNYAQDLQISVRGFGARSSFGVRGVRLYSDGIPATMPDGQGQVSHFDLGSAGRIEVLRGPFSALYGNSSGGVISLYTEDAPPDASVTVSATAGSLGLQRYALKAMGRPGGVNLVVNAAHFAIDGYREHSAAERNTLNAKAAWQLDSASKLTLVANAINMPDAQDPLGLTRAQLTADPAQAGTNAIAYNTRKSVSQEQGGATYEHAFGTGDALVVLAYGGHRHTTQFQAILQSVQLARPTHPGGVIDLDRNYGGGDLHYSAQRALAGGSLQLTGGVSYDVLDEARKGYLNFSGEQLGVQGELRRDETNDVYDLDEYLQAQWDSGERWLAMLGARNSLVDVSSHNHLAAAGSGDPGAVRYTAFTPVAGLTLRAAPKVNVYAAYGKGFETPTLSELAYRSTDGSLPGLNLGLQPARSDNYELGAKLTGPRLQATLAGFYIDTHDELAVLSSSGGRTVYQNIVDTQRRGAELAMQAALPARLQLRLAYTWIEAVTATDKRLPAVPANTVYAALTWTHPSGNLSVTLEGLGRSRFYVNDANSDAAAGYAMLGLRCDLQQQRGAWRFSESVRVDNLGDRSYVGTVIVNESNARYFEPGPGRTAYLLVTASH